MTRSILFRHRSGSSNLPPRAAWHGEGERDAIAVDQSGWEQRAGVIFGIRGFLAVKAGLRGFWAECRAVPDREFEPPTSLRFGNVGVHMTGCA